MLGYGRWQIWQRSAGSGKIESIPWCELCTSVSNFLGNDLFGCFNRNLPPFVVSQGKARLSEEMSGQEVDLALGPFELEVMSWPLELRGDQRSFGIPPEV